MNLEQLTKFRSLPRWQRRTSVLMLLPIWPFIAGWSVLACFFHELGYAFRYSWIDLKGCWKELRVAWREMNR